VITSECLYFKICSLVLPFFVLSNLVLSFTIAAQYIRVPECSMFSCPSANAYTPIPKRCKLQLMLHYVDNLFFSESKLQFNRFERGPVFPSHLDNPRLFMEWQSTKSVYNHVEVPARDVTCLLVARLWRDLR